MSAEDFKYSPRYLGKKDTTKLKSNWDNDLIMHWIETQPNPLLAPEFYEPMAEHDSPQIALSRDIREHLGEFWSPGEDFIHPLAVEFLEHEEERAAVEAAVEASEAAEAVLASLREMGMEDAMLVDEEESEEASEDIEKSEEEEDKDDESDDGTVIEIK